MEDTSNGRIFSLHIMRLASLNSTRLLHFTYQTALPSRLVWLCTQTGLEMPTSNLYTRLLCQCFLEMMVHRRKVLRLHLNICFLDILIVIFFITDYGSSRLC